MKKICILLLCFPFCVFAQKYQDLSQKEVFTKGYPQIISFRGEKRKAVHTNEKVWANKLNPSNGVFKKFVNIDELPDINPITRTWAVNYLNNNPTKLVLNHFFAQQHVNNIVGSSDRYFPGHWLSVPGSTLTKAIGTNDTKISVQDISKFTQTYSDGTIKFPVLMIVQLGADGQRDFSTAEFVTFKNSAAINKEISTITVKRATTLSTAKSHPAGAVVVPMLSRLGKENAFDYNLSTTCPKDANGKTAADIAIEELTELHQAGGLLAFTQGIALDVGRWTPRIEEADVNNDGVSDNGYINNINEYGKGVYNFAKRIRTVLGSDKIFTCDGNSSHSQRNIGIFNGIESEGLVQHNDAYRGFSKTINVFSYWNEVNPVNYKLNLIVTKFNNPLDASTVSDKKKIGEKLFDGKDNLIRLAKATTTCLDAAYSREHDQSFTDEDLGGDLNTLNWLGKPTGNLIRIAKQTPDVLLGNGTKATNWSAKKATITNNGSELVVKGNSSNKRDNIKISYNNLKIGNTGDDIVIYVEVQSLGKLLDFPANIPRHLTADAGNLPTLETKKRDQELHNDLWGYMDTSGTRLLSFYYRKAGGKNLNFSLTAEENGDFIIKSISAHVSPQLLAREYENGAVLINPSLSDQTFDLSALFPNKKFKKLNGTTDNSHNDGSVLGTTVVVPATDALFISKSNKVSKGNKKRENRRK